MKLKQITLALCTAAIFASCSNTVTLPGFERTVYVDYSLFRANGIEVTDGKVPDGCTPVGQISEIIRKSRTITYKSVSDKRNDGDDDIILPKSRTMVTSDSNAELDTKFMVSKIANIVKEKGGKGIAKLFVTVENPETHPTFFISGIIYK